MTTYSDNLTEKVEEILREKKRTSGGNCGTYPASILLQLGVPYSELRAVLNKLYITKKITIHEGAHGKLIKWKGKI